MPYVNNPSVPSLSSSVDPSVKSAIQYITNYLTKFNTTLGTSLGSYSSIGSTGTLVTLIPDGSIPDSKLTINLNKRIDLIDTPDVGLVDSLFRLEVLQPTVFIQELEPTAIAISDIWVHPISLVSKRWSGAEWLAISPQPNIELISVDPPMSPAQGDIWIKIIDEDLKQYTWYTWLTDQWQQYDPASALYINSIATNANTTNIAAVTAINNVSATSDSANARALYTTKSAVEHPTTGLTSKASITALSTANSTLAKAVASSIVQTSTTLNGKTSTIETMAESVDGVKAQYTVKLNANDKVAGFGLMLDEGAPSTFEILADKFAIVHSDGVNSTSPFTVSGSNTYIQNALIKNAAIDTLKIAGNAVTTAQYSMGGSSPAQVSYTASDPNILPTLLILGTAYIDGPNNYIVGVEAYLNGIKYSSVGTSYIWQPAIYGKWASIGGVFTIPTIGTWTFKVYNPTLNYFFDSIQYMAGKR